MLMIMMIPSTRTASVKINKKQLVLTGPNVAYFITSPLKILSGLVNNLPYHSSSSSSTTGAN
jgi:hypothetical protein